MLATLEDATGVVPMLKLAVVAPCGTVTNGGTVADALLLDKATTTLLAAACVNVSVPVDEFPPITLVGLTVIEESAAGAELKFALTDFAASIMTLQPPVPLQAPLQPANVEPESGVAVKLTTVPLAKFAEHVVPQEIPGGELATVPVPVPLFATVRVKGAELAVKFALTDFAASMVTLHAPVPLQAPLQPANVEPESGVAVKLTTVLLAKLAEHVVPQEIPAGELATVPVPVPLFVIVRVNDVEAAPVINLLRTFVVAC
jgi:LEA14-like dessication related protein